MQKSRYLKTRSLICLLAVVAVFFFQTTLSKAASDSDSASDSLVLLGNLIQHGENDSVRITANKIFKSKLKEIILKPDPFDFDSVKNISVLTPPDKSFRLYTWTVPSYAGSYSFFGFLQTFNKKTGETKVDDLLDSTYALEKPDASKLTPDKWFGAVYYKIIPTKKDGKMYYILLGWKGKSSLSTQKVIDVLYFPGNKPMFGFPLFKTGKVYSSRMIFEYPSQAVMSLRYEESKKMIVFDHLSSFQNFVSGPDGSYDALKFTGGKWVLMKDIDIRTDWKSKPQPKEPQIHEAPVEFIK